MFSFQRVIVTIVCICVIFHIGFLYGYMTRIYTIYVHCLKISNLLVRALQTGRKASLWRDFLVCFATSANQFHIQRVPILCLSCNIKKSKKTTAKLSENNWNKRRSYRFQWCHMWRQRLWPFLSVALHGSGARNALLGPWPSSTEVYLTPFIGTQKQTVAG